jgi:hypothetical protein
MRRLWLPLGAALLASACGEETATGVGAGLLPPDVIQTFEVVLEPERFLVGDTAFGLYSRPRQMDFLIIAERFEGSLNSHALAQFLIPTAITVVDAAGATTLDTVPILTGGTLRLIVDTLQSTTEPVRLALFRTAEEWDETATWAHRVDTVGVRLPWAQPGGTRGVLVDTATYRAGADTLVFRVDSATIAAWADTADATRGGLLVMQTAGGRLRTRAPTLEVQARSTLRPDTIYTATAPLMEHTFIFEPAPPEAAPAPRVGGTPAWRSILELRERLDTISVPCPAGPGCRVALGDVTINFAGLVLQPTTPPAGMRPEGPLTVGAYLVLPSDLVPIQRAPLDQLVGFAVVPASRFEAPGAPAVTVSITDLIRVATLGPTADAFVPTHVALLAVDQRTFGFATFESMPRLRLVLSTAKELQLP